MQKLNKNLFNPYFSHIYIEKNALNHPNTSKILNHFSKIEIIEINHYKDVFSRSHQNFSLQKQSPKLILAIKNDNLIYKGASVCEDFGNNYFYYTSTIMNCIYDCEYCYLQGMYTSANIVIFVNIEDIFSEVERLLKKHPIYLCISYDTDILAFENIIGYGNKWINFAKKHNDLNVELRTKSANFNSIKNVEPIENIILAWTLSPNEIIKKYEKRTPSLQDRLLAINEAIDKGWKVRLCFDPMLYVKEWKKYYKNLIEATFLNLPREKIHDISIGVFRVSKDYLKKMRKQRFDSVILNYPFETVDGICSYDYKLSENMIKYVYQLIKKYVPEEKIYI
ncbi:SPL family radical SAM protein [Tepidibacter thalassicus]|uniref:SPL family radical SAM protein n=1 Tax=Tepidibacter thalassicus TaxID=214905 RepID=UPI000933B4E4|nr:DNA repair photolyase [Tepidibacter thalassicus]